MRRRLLAGLAAAAVATAVPAVPAAPALAGGRRNGPPPVCNLMGDALPDAPVWGLPASKAPQDADAELLSADIGSDARWLTVVLRVRSLAQPDATWPFAHSYVVTWRVPGHATPVYLSTTLDPNNPAVAAYGPQSAFGDMGALPVEPVLVWFNVLPVTVKTRINAALGTITMTVPLSALKPYGQFTPGTLFGSLEATTQEAVNGPDTPNLPGFGGSLAQAETVDDDPASGPYFAGTPSCVKPGS